MRLGSCGCSGLYVDLLFKTLFLVYVICRYGDDEQTVPRDYATRVCNLFGQLSLRGISFIFSSGDGGVAGGQTPPYCASNDGKNTTK